MTKEKYKKILDEIHEISSKCDDIQDPKAFYDILNKISKLSELKDKILEYAICIKDNNGDRIEIARVSKEDLDDTECSAWENSFASHKYESLKNITVDGLIVYKIFE